MNWVKTRQFQIVNRNGRHYVYRRNNTGNTEINVPAHIRTKAQAEKWLTNNPERVKKPTKYKPRGAKHAVNASVLMGTANFMTRSPNVPLNCSAKSKLFKVVTNNGRTGFKATKPMNGAKLATVPNANLKTSPGLARIGRGRAGVVYLASTSSRRHNYVAIKVIPHDKSAESRKEPQPAYVEYAIQRQVQSVDEWVKGHVVNIYNMVHCMDFVDPREINVNNLASMNTSKQSVLFMQYARGGSLLDWMNKMARARKLNDEFMVVAITQVLRTLYRIMKKYPDFRHNDLHIENLFVQDGYAHLKWPVILIGDFGWARTKKMGTNPAVNTARRGGVTAGAYGVGPDTDARYDTHLFLNELHEWCLKHKADAPGGFAKTIAFLERVLPVGYRGESNTHVSKWRLKYDDPCPGLPKLSEILKDKFLKRNLNAPLNVGHNYYIDNINRKSPAKVKAKTPSPLRAKAKTPSPKKKWTNEELRTISATNFARLSPATRARALALRKNRPKNKKPSTPKAKKAPSPPKKAKTPPKKVTHKPLPKGVLKNAKFDRLVNKLWREAGAKANANYNNAWANARRRAINIIQARVNANQPPFSPSPIRKAKTPSPPRAPRKTPSPPKAPKKAPNNFVISPSSKRIKIRAPNSGRLVYANGPTITLTYLKNMATRRGVNIKGLRSKNSIARKIFGQ